MKSPSSAITREFSPSTNLAVPDEPPAVDTDWPRPMASDDEKASMSIIVGLWRSRPSLDSWLHITPDEVIMNTDERSQRSGSASRARRMGLAKASPTMVMACTPSRSVTSSSSPMSRWRASRVTLLPAPHRASWAVNMPVPCMSGHAGSSLMPGLARSPARAS